MSDPIDIVRDMTPQVGPQPELFDRARRDLMATITQSPRSDADTRPRRGSRRRWTVSLAAAVLVTTAAAGWVAVLRDTSDSTSLQCPGNAVIDGVTGDPVLDCSNQWRREHGTEAPPMAAFDNGRGGVAVLLEGDPVPAEYTALEPGRFQNAALIQLEAALDDVATGLESACHDVATATEITRRELDRLGLPGWTVIVDESRRPDGSSMCAYFIVDPVLRQVQLIGLSGAAGPDPFTPFATALDERLSSGCIGLDEAADLTRALAAATEVVVDGTPIDLVEESGGLVIHVVEDPNVACTRADVNVGGRVEVTLRGPAG